MDVSNQMTFIFSCIALMIAAGTLCALLISFSLPKIPIISTIILVLLMLPTSLKRGRGIIYYSARSVYNGINFFVKVSVRTYQEREEHNAYASVVRTSSLLETLLFKPAYFDCCTGNRCRKKFHFLCLPFEVRRMVYRHTLEHHYELDCRPSILLRPRKQLKNALALLRTCRQIRHEARSVLFSSTLFHIFTRYPFYRQLSPDIWTFLREINVAAQRNKRGNSKLQSVLLDLRHMPQLRDIYITIDDADDFLKQLSALSDLHTEVKQLLTRLSLIQVIVKSVRAKNKEVRLGMQTLISSSQTVWPENSTFTFTWTDHGKKVTIWKSTVMLAGHALPRRYYMDDDTQVVYSGHTSD